MSQPSIHIWTMIFAIAGLYLFTPSCTNQEEDEKKQETGKTENLPKDTTLAGDYICLPHRGVKPGEPTTAECAFGMQTEDGNYYAINLAAASQPMINLHPGDRIRVSGTLTGVTPADSQWYRYEANMLVTVTGVMEKVTYDSRGFQYSSEPASKEIFVDIPKPGSKIDLPLTVTGRVKQGWLSQSQWGPKGTMRLILEDETGMQVAAETTVKATGNADANGFVSFTGKLTIGEHTQATTGYVVIYQSNFSKRREYIKVPVKFQ